jgi:hypothetical protein
VRTLLGIASSQPVVGIATVDVRTEISAFHHAPNLCCLAAAPRIGDRSMRRTNASRSIAIARRRSDDVQPTAILGAIGMITTLILLWTSLTL